MGIERDRLIDFSLNGLALQSCVVNQWWVRIHIAIIVQSGINSAVCLEVFESRALAHDACAVPKPAASWQTLLQKVYLTRSSSRAWR